MTPPEALHEVIRRKTAGPTPAERFTNPILLVPVIGAFLQMLWTRSVPSLAWPLLLLVAAIATRALKAVSDVRERPASLGVDGLELQGRFIPVPDLAHVERRDDVVWVTTRAGERIELRADAAEIDRAAHVAEALGRAIVVDRRDAAGEWLLADVDAIALRGAAEAYRDPALDAERCLAVVEDVAASPKARIAAAEILGRHAVDDEAVRVRIGEAAGSTANPALREALLDTVTTPPSRRLNG
jgi:hypothetical protein